MITDRFSLVSEYDIVDQFYNLKQADSMVDYVDRFEEMVSMVKRHNASMSNTYFICSFISGLKDHIQYHLQCHRPIALSQAYQYPKRLEHATPIFRKYNTFISKNKVHKSEVKEKANTNPSLAELKVARKCFKCREPWVPGHGKVCKGKQLYSVILVENVEGTKEVAIVEDSDETAETDLQNTNTMATY